jgi:hypothetical protein
VAALDDRVAALEKRITALESDMTNAKTAIKANEAAAEVAKKHGRGVTGPTGATGPTGPGPSGPTAPTGPTGGTAAAQTIDAFTVTPSSILSGSGDAVVIAWTTSHSTSVTLNGVTAAASGSVTQHPTISGSYNLIAFGSAAPVSLTRTFTVILPQTINAFTASPAAIALGATSSLSWSTSNATGVTLDGVAVATTGSQGVSPLTSTAYTLDASGAAPDVIAVARVTVVVDTSTTPFTISRTGVAYATLQQAHDDAVAGDTIKVAYGNYVVASAFGVASPRLICQKNITIEWATAGFMPSFDYSAVAQGDTNVGGSGTAIEMGTACTSLTVRGIQIIGKQIPNAPACAFVNVISGYPGNTTPYTLLLEYCSLLQWTNGILTGPNVGGQVTMRYCLIENCMAGDGLSHGIYVSDINTLTVEGCTFRTTPGGVGGDVGHLFKTRAKTHTVRSSIFLGTGGCSRCMDISNGGILTITGCFLHKYDDGQANQVIRFGAEQRQGQPTFINDGRTHSIFMAQSTLENPQAQHILQIDAVTDVNGNVLPITETVRNNVAAGPFASDITAFANNVEVALSEISPTGQLTIAAIAGTTNDATTQYAGLFTPPTARADSNKGAFGTGLPTWIPSTANAYTAVPTSTPSLYLKNDGTGILPAAWNVGAGQGSNYQQCDSFGGPAFSQKLNEIWQFGGGHSATNMNPLTKLSLNAASPAWVAVDTGSTSALMTTDWANTATWNLSNFQSDGRPKSTHTYRNNQFFDNVTELVVMGFGAMNSPTTGNLNLRASAGFPLGGSAWRPAGYWPPMPTESSGSSGAIEACVCRVPDGSGAYLIQDGNQLRLLDCLTRAYTVIGPAQFHSWIGGNNSRMGCNSTTTICAIAMIGGPPADYSIRFIDTRPGWRQR